jgi:hypothetical protein
MWILRIRIQHWFQQLLPGGMWEGELVDGAHSGDEDDHGAPGLVHRDSHQQWRVLVLQAGLRNRIWIRIVSAFNRVSGSGSRRAKMTHKSRKKLGNCMF